MCPEMARKFSYWSAPEGYIEWRSLRLEASHFWYPTGQCSWPGFVYNIHKPDLPDLLKSTCKLFADDTKLYKAISSCEDQNVLQQDLLTLCDWSDDWLLRFNVLKCKYIQYGIVNFVFEYQMRDIHGNTTSLLKDSQEKDLGIIFQDNLKFDQHISNAVGRANRLLGLIKRSFIYMNSDLFLKLYKTLVRPIIDYGNVIWYPFTKKDKKN